MSSHAYCGTYADSAVTSGLAFGYPGVVSQFDTALVTSVLPWHKQLVN